jgi:hypothetical protein
MRAAYGDATAGIFMISAAVSVVALLAVLFIKETPLRRTVDVTPESTLSANAAAEAGMTARTGQVPLVSASGSRAGAGRAAAAGAARGTTSDGGAATAHAAGSGAVATDDLEEAFARSFGSVPFGSGTAAEDARSSDSADRISAAVASAAATLQKLQETQHLLARQQVELGKLVLDIQEQLRSQREVAAQQAGTASELSRLKRKLLKERKTQAAAALYLAGHGRHSAVGRQDDGAPSGR